MPPRINPLKLNNLQLRTLALAQVLAREPAVATHNDVTGEVTLHRLPHPHGDHVHIGPFVVSAREASGFANPSVWVALERKGLAHGFSPLGVTLTPAAIGYDTGLGGQFLEESDH